jgi:glycosyltransferase involved in cell wall biosynthesis
MPSATLHVLDVDASYRPAGVERVLTPDQVGVDTPRLHRMAVQLEPSALQWALYPALLRAVAAQVGEGTMLAIQPGVLLLSEPAAMLASTAEICVVARTIGPLPDDGRWPDASDLARAGTCATGLVALRAPSAGFLADWAAAATTAADPCSVALGAASDRTAVLDDAAALLTAWNLTGGTITATRTGGLRFDERDVAAVDLSRLDPGHPWLLDATGGDPRARLSEHPALAELVGRYGADVLAEAARADTNEPGWDLTGTSLGTAVDPPLRELFRALPDAEEAPDAYDPLTADRLLKWLTTPATQGAPARYLAGIHRSRPDLQRTFPRVPGADTPAFLAWVRTYAQGEGYPAVLVAPALAGAPRTLRPVLPARPVWPGPRPRRRRPAHGVNVIGFLGGDFGLGESARLMVGALQAAGIPHTTVAVDQRELSSRLSGATDSGPATETFDTSLLCVNADLTPAVAAALPRPGAATHRIGMWYWEVEDFPVEQHGGFSHVDEVWTATEFIRAAIAPHSPVPVHVVAPPLPQRGTEPTMGPAQLGLPDRPYFLFSFDYSSTAERKNPMGLVEAFTAAFAPGEGPVLVIKSINARKRPAEAERLRLRVANEQDVVLMDRFLDPAERDALVASCACYVSLHRSEGLGLTMAEAMAWGRPVIATAYSGNLDFMTDENSFLVPWSPATIPADAVPYPPGGTWAEPDLAAAAALMRAVVDHPDVAASIGARAAADIADRHTPEVAGRAMAARLAQTAGRRGARARRTVTRLARGAVRAVRAAIG